MKKLNVFRLGLLFAGCFLGAGYVSGQELRQYFVVYGAKGYLGLLAAVAILYIFGVLCLRMAQRTGLTGADELVVPWRAPWLHALVMVLESLFLFALVTIMCAGVGALLEQVFAIPHWLGSLLFAALVLACALAGAVTETDALISAVAVLPQVRRRGLGRLAVDELCERLCGRRCHALRAEEENAEFYAALGFEENGRWAECTL